MALRKGRHLGERVQFLGGVGGALYEVDARIGGTRIAKRARPVACNDQGLVCKYVVWIMTGKVIELPVVVVAGVEWRDEKAETTRLVARKPVPIRVLVLVRGARGTTAARNR